MRNAVVGTELIHYVIREDLLMQFSQLNNEDWAQACANDGEFLQAARHWQGGQYAEQSVSLAAVGQPHR